VRQTPRLSTRLLNVKPDQSGRDKRKRLPPPEVTLRLPPNFPQKLPPEVTSEVTPGIKRQERRSQRSMPSAEHLSRLSTNYMLSPVE
jgi:hypothetical protein